MTKAKDALALAKEIFWIVSVILAFGGFCFGVGAFVRQARNDSDEVKAIKGDIAQIRADASSTDRRLASLDGQVRALLDTIPKALKSAQGCPGFNFRYSSAALPRQTYATQ
jgi:hypothetical protein